MHAEVRASLIVRAVACGSMHRCDTCVSIRAPRALVQVRYASDDVLYLHHLHAQFKAALQPVILERVRTGREGCCYGTGGGAGAADIVACVVLHVTRGRDRASSSAQALRVAPTL